MSFDFDEQWIWLARPFLDVHIKHALGKVFKKDRFLVFRLGLFRMSMPDILFSGVISQAVKMVGIKSRLRASSVVFLWGEILPGLLIMMGVLTFFSLGEAFKEPHLLFKFHQLIISCVQPKYFLIVPTYLSH